MIRRFGSMIGVTLLEILLVLAIAAMIIVMSVRYYQGASASAQVNAFLQQLQGIAAAADSLAIGSGSYSGTTQSNIVTFLGGSTAVFGLPWGGSISVSAGASTYTLTISPRPSAAVCAQIISKIQQNSRYSGYSTTCQTFRYSATS
ncbi:MAG TPA: type II secretion system protein [Gammaproteobacteria bacterium]|nr:type II secretion system protein [Gammaproteobacteria bacterium]